MGKIFDAWKKLGFKLTGKKIKDSKNLSTIIEDIADNYQGGGGGTTVVANPTLSGTESDLTSLQVGDTKYKVSGGGADLGAQYQNVNKVFDLFNAACPYDETLGAYKQTKLDVTKLKALLLAANLDLTKPVSSNGNGNSLCICVPPIKGYGTEGYAQFSSSDSVYIVYNINILVDSDTGAPTGIEIKSGDSYYIDSISISDSTPHLAALTSSSTFADLFDAMIADNVNLIFTYEDSEYYKPVPFHNLGLTGSGNEIKNAPVFATIISFIALNDDNGTDVIADNIYFDDFIECIDEVEE